MNLTQAANLTDGQVEGLLAAYLERKKFETKIMLSMVGEALKPKEQTMSLGALAAAGFGIRGA